MKYLKNPAVIILIGALVISGMIVYRNRSTQSTPTTNTTSQKIDSQQQQEEQIDDQANVTVLIKPIDLSPQSSEWKFGVSMNTHTVELDQDLMQVAILIDSSGKEYKPLRWEGPVGGHHRSGVLVFATVSPYPSQVMLKISGVAGVERSFVWNLAK